MMAAQVGTGGTGMTIQKRKVIILGAGRVGGGCGISLVLRGDVDELVFLDIDRHRAEAQALDLCNVVSYLPKQIRVRAGDYSDCPDAHVLILTAGVARLPGQRREEELDGSMRVVSKIIEPLRDSGFGGILICVTNPADVICDYVRKHTGIERRKIFSSGTAMDSTRIRHVLSEATGVAPASIQAWCLGEHGPNQMVSWSQASINGMSLIGLMERYPETYGKLNFDEVLAAAKREGPHISDGKGISEFGIGYTVSEIVFPILCDQKAVLPVAPLLEGEYGQRDVHASVPCVIGKNGVEQILEISMTTEEKARFDASCDAIRAGIEIAAKWEG